MNQPRIVCGLKLLMLLANNRYMTNEQICEHFEFSQRTLFRYIDTFREAGFVVKKNENKVYKIETSENKLSKHLCDLLHFTEEEELILLNAIDSIEPVSESRENLKKKLYAVYDYKLLSDAAFTRKDREIFMNLSKAIENKKQVILNGYRSAHSNTTSNRKVEPYAFTDAKDQIWCYETGSSMVKTFRISRIEDVQILESGWKFENQHKVGYVDIFRMHSTQRFHIRLKLSLRAANLLMEEYPLSVKFLKKTNNNRYVLDTEVCRFEGVSRFILGLYDDIEILENDDLKNFIKYRIQMMNC